MIRGLGDKDKFLPVKLGEFGQSAMICSDGRRGPPVGQLREEESAMYLLDHVTAINPFVLAVLAIVIICGCYDRWVTPKGH